MNFSSCGLACTNSTSASPRRPVSRAWPVPCATTFTSMPVLALNSGRIWPNRPESCVDVVEATTIDLSCACTGEAARDDGADDIFDRFGRSRVEACRRLVEEEDLGLLGQGARKRKPLLLAAGELPCRTIIETVEADEGTELAGARLAFRARHAG